MSFIDLDKPILSIPYPGGSAEWTMRDAVEGVQIFGGIGSGKTSGSGKMLALKYLAHEFGRLVLTAKPDEKDLWIQYCKITIKDDNGKSISLPTENSKRYDVFAKTEISIAKGDSLRITRNGFDQGKKRLDNGDLLEVVSVKMKGDILLRNKLSKEKYKIKNDFGHLAHAH